MVLGVYGLGYLTGSYSTSHPAVLTGDGYVGADQASFQVGDTTYGFRSTVTWTDAAGSLHDNGWPACLPKLQSVSGVRFVAATIWAGGSGSSQVVWVDCQGR